MKEEAEKISQAVALRYEREQNNVPRVVAKGKGLVADNILQAAKQHRVPVYQNKTLTNMLMALELDREIPIELYQAVAEILAYIYRLDKRR
ncbi:MAG: FlhB domain protein [Firmicutes bacterium]|nr:FlhB domain protein [Bacillota bacterium]